MKLTFLQAANGQRLSKRYTPTGVTSYPLVKNFNSAEIELTEDESTPWYHHAYLALTEYAGNGYALYKGELAGILVNESRKGQTLTENRNRLIAIDIDGLDIPQYTPPEQPDQIEKDQLRELCEAVVALLPEPLHNASYIGHASASMGIKSGVRLHLFFLLDESIMPKQHKSLLLAANFSNRTMKAATELTASGLALRYPVDPALGDNSRIIYIADPEFEQMIDPVLQRFIIVAKEQQLVEAKEIRRYLRDCGGVDGIKQHSRRRVNELRQQQGLPAKSPVTATVVTAQGTEKPAVNPDRMELVEVASDDFYIRFNLNNGDSNAYWVHRDDPRIVYNFKGEPPFLFANADPKTYEATCKKYGFDDKTDSIETNVLFYDPKRDMNMGGIIDITNNRVVGSIIPRKTENFKHFMQGAENVPETLPTVEYVFDPTDDREVDLQNGFINSFTLQEVLKNPVAIGEEFVDVGLSDVHGALSKLCPSLYKVMYSVTGTDASEKGEELERFINWLAFICQTRQRTGTAWLFHGTEGTGKGLLLNKVIIPLLGEEHAVERTQVDLEDRFNDWMERSLVVALDELLIANKADRKLFNKLKSFITETTVPLRAMRQGVRSAPSYMNLMIFSNDRDVVTVTANDRRFNVCPRQETPLFQRYPNLNSTLDDDAERELPRLAAFLMHFQFNGELVREVLKNDAKVELKEATQDNVSLFVDTIRNGDVEGLFSILEMLPYNMEAEEHRAYAMVEEAIKSIDLSSGAPLDALRYSTADLLAIYQLLNGEGSYRGGSRSFSRSLAKCGLRQSEKTMRKKKHQAFANESKPFKGYEVKWCATDSGLEYIKQYIAAASMTNDGEWDGE